MTPEQEASYQKQLDAMPATPDWIVGLRRDTLYKGSLDEADKETVEVGIVKPSTPADTVVSHIFDTPDQFAATSGALVKSYLRLPTITDPYLPSARMTPHGLPIVPRRETTQLPPRLGDDTADAPEHITPVETLINRAIVTFRQEQQRLPHAITVNMIRFAQHWINTRSHKLFFYHTEYGDVEIPIQPAAAGELLTDEVRLD